MLELFTNPGYLAAGSALVSAPIIIHLINRMRFKRLKWAAMEFLLKSQKRNRRRLIIEQLILLALRCFLVILTALLVLRFVGLSLAGFQAQEGLHVIVLDDTLSMSDKHKEAGADRNCFQVAKEEVILKTIYKNVAQSTTNERLAIIPLSALVNDPDYQPKIYSKLGEKATENEIIRELEPLKVSALRVPLARGLKHAAKLLGDNVQYRHVLHIVSDFRSCDWIEEKVRDPYKGGIRDLHKLLEQQRSDIKDLHKLLEQLVNNKVKIWLRDAAHPYRTAGQSGQMPSHDNLAIIDFRANTRVIGKGMPVTFTVTVANFTPRDEQVNLIIRDDETGNELPQIDFNTPMPMKVPQNDIATVSFELRLFPEIKPNQKFFAQKISAHLENAQRKPLENDGIEVDNVRFASVEVREKVPVLVIDGKGSEGRAENKDSFFLEAAIVSVPGASYEIKYADELTGGNPLKILDQPELSQYPSIFLLNVPQLTTKQRDNLESYVKEGGGVGFFLGPQVAGSHYTKELFRNHRGLFPVPIEESYYPPSNQEPRKAKYTGDLQLRLRKDQVADRMEDLPIFGPIFKDEKQLVFLKDLPIRRYFRAQRDGWNPEPGRVIELATLPNDNLASAYTRVVVQLTEKLLADKPEFKPYQRALKRHADAIRAVVAPGSEAKAYQLAGALENLLNDQGRREKEDGPYLADYPNLQEFWALPENKSLKDEVSRLRHGTLYGDPLVVAQRFGKGKVVAVLTTAGKEWSDWGGGSDASFIFQPFIWEMQNYLSSQGPEAALTVGTPIKIDVDAGRFKKQGGVRLMTVRTFHKAQPGKQVQITAEQPNFGSESKDGVQTFFYDRTFEPGFYLTELFDNADPKTPLAGWGHVYNVDAAVEGQLRRLSQAQMEQALPKSVASNLNISGPHGSPEELVNKQTDMSESPWFFLLFLLVLVSEQALAVHLSFHLRTGEAQMPAAVAPQARAA